jgi:putative DNA-binding protein
MLLELQIQFCRAVLGGDTTEIVSQIRGDELPPAARLQIYRNHAVTTLGAALGATFPIVRRLVDARFFAYAAHEYLRGQPPYSRCLIEYGAEFADFLAGFDACKNVPYLADVARFEWGLKIAATMRERTPLAIDALAEVSPETAPCVSLCLQPSASYLASAWPIDVIWQANQLTVVPTIDLASGGVRIEIRRCGEGSAWQRLDAGAFTFRKALAAGVTLAAAAAAASAIDPPFDLETALDRIFSDGLAIGLDAC